MFKQPDHVNIPSAKGLRAIGVRVGFVPLRVWSSEYPLETFVLAVRMKDWFSEWRPSREVNHPIGAGAATVAYESIGRRLIRARLFAAVGGNRSSRGLFRAEAVRAFVDEHRSGAQEWSMQIRQLLTLELCMPTFLDGGGKHASADLIHRQQAATA